MATSQPTPHQSNNTLLNPFTIINSLLFLLASGGSVLLRVYFIHGGQRIWLSSLVQFAGWPILFIPLIFSRKKTHISFSLILIFSFLGLLMAVDGYFYAQAASFLPVPTSSLLLFSQPTFTVIFAYLIVRQKFTAFSLNAVVLLTMGPVVLSLGYGSDVSEGELKAKYFLGSGLAVATAALIGLIFPLTELAVRRGKVAVVNYTTVMEIQHVMCVAGSVFCLVGMAINKDFQAIPWEALEFGLSDRKYYMVLVWDAVMWQLSTIGMAGFLCGTSSLFVGVIFAVLLPVSQVLSVIFLYEKFDSIKGVTLALSIWGIVSYLYGEKKLNDVQNEDGLTREVEMP